MQDSVKIIFCEKMARHKRLFMLLSACIFIVVSASLAYAIDKGVHIFRVGTGASATSSYLTGIQLSKSISKPPGFFSCANSGICGVPGLIALTQTQKNAKIGVQSLLNEKIESILLHADMASWAVKGTGIFSDIENYQSLRSIAVLRPEHMHIIVREDKNINSISDLDNKKISLGADDTSTPSLAKNILRRYSVDIKNITALRLGSNDAMNALLDGTIDAAFFIESIPSKAVEQLFELAPVKLLPLKGVDLIEMQFTYPFIHPSFIPANSYKNAENFPTVGMDLMWITTRHQSNQLIEKIVQALWNNQEGAEFLKINHLEKSAHAMRNLERKNINGVPFHDGALEYFRKIVAVDTANKDN